MESGNPRDFVCDIYPRVGILIGHHAFDLSISNSRREVNHYFVSDNFYFCPGNRPPLPSPLGLDIDRCIITSIFISWFMISIYNIKIKQITKNNLFSGVIENARTTALRPPGEIYVLYQSPFNIFN